MNNKNKKNEKDIMDDILSSFKESLKTTNGKISVFSFLIIISMVFPLEYYFYQAFRFIITGAMIWLSLNLYSIESERKKIVLPVCLAILFNPILPFSMARESWIIIDIAAALAIYLVFIHKEKATDNLATHENSRKTYDGRAQSNTNKALVSEHLKYNSPIEELIEKPNKRSSKMTIGKFSSVIFISLLACIGIVTLAIEISGSHYSVNWEKFAVVLIASISIFALIIWATLERLELLKISQLYSLLLFIPVINIILIIVLLLIEDDSKKNEP